MILQLELEQPANSNKIQFPLVFTRSIVIYYGLTRTQLT